MLIGGQRVDAASGEWFESFNPYNGKPWALIPRASPEDVNAAVAAARTAFKSKEWRGLTATARGKLLLKNRGPDRGARRRTRLRSRPPTTAS